MRVRLSLLPFEALDDTDTTWQENPASIFPAPFITPPVCRQSRSVAATKDGSSSAMTMTGNITLRFFKGCQPDSAGNSTVTCRETSQIRWIIAKIAVEEAGYRLMEVARYLSRDAGVMSRGLG